MVDASLNCMDLQQVILQSEFENDVQNGTQIDFCGLATVDEEPDVIIKEIEEESKKEIEWAIISVSGILD